jgi:hypothetical protein
MKGSESLLVLGKLWMSFMMYEIKTGQKHGDTEERKTRNESKARDGGRDQSRNALLSPSNLKALRIQ